MTLAAIGVVNPHNSELVDLDKLAEDCLGSLVYECEQLLGMLTKKLRDMKRKELQGLIDKSPTLSVVKLAKIVGLNPQTIYNFLAGRSLLTGSNHEKLIKALHEIS